MLSESRGSGLVGENASDQTNKVFSSLRKCISATSMPAKMTKEGQVFGLPQGWEAQSTCQVAVKSFSYTKTSPRPLLWQKSIKSHELQASALLLYPAQFLTVFAHSRAAPQASSPQSNYPQAADGREESDPVTLTLWKISLTFFSVGESAHFVSTELLVFSQIAAHPGSQVRWQCFLFFLPLTCLLIL